MKVINLINGTRKQLIEDAKIKLSFWREKKADKAFYVAHKQQVDFYVKFWSAFLRTR